jgi:glucose/arabinose dehydrogenase/regulation of enolase protein 1 (concanavalin A-like superfamily)
MLKRLLSKFKTDRLSKGSLFSSRSIIIYAAAAAIIGGIVLNISHAASITITTRDIGSGYTEPTNIVSTGIAGDNRLFILERAGSIKIIRTTGVKNATPFLNLTSKVNSNGGSGEDGLMGLVFHPNYSNNRFLYVSYVIGDQSLNVSRFTRDATNPDIVDPASEIVLLNIPHPGQSNHNGGDLHFGPDGYLYITTGDGGGGGNPSNSAQNLSSLQGKMLRIDVDNGSPYAIPPSNPFAGSSTAKKEIWAYGLRNPWRFSFDKATNDLWIGDVGQDVREEVDFQAAGSAGGQNYGWRCYEGNNNFNLTGCAAKSSYVFPIGEYDHASGRCALIGGYVYRGAQYPAMAGHYFFTDFCTGDFYTLYPNGAGGWTQELLLRLPNNPGAFGQDNNGELYLVDNFSGHIYHLETTTQLTDTTAPTSSITAPAANATLSNTATISASASDNVGVTKVELVIDGTVKGTITSSPYTYSWDTQGVSNGSHTILARAYDAAGNVGSSSTINVTTNNTTPSPLPSPWVDADVGDVGAWGTASSSSGMFTVKGAGADIGGTTDAHHFVYQALNGDGQITARINSLQNTDPNAKAGLMIRDSLNPNSINFSLLATPTAAGGMVFETRSTASGNTSTTSAVTNIAAPYWLRLQRQGSRIIAYWSANGTTWSDITTSTVNLSVNSYMGLAVSSHSKTTLTTATFDNVELIAGGNSPPLIDILYPGHSGIFSGTINVTTNVSDADGISKVEFYIDNTLVATDTTSPYAYSWDSTQYSNGSHNLTAIAYDTLNNQSNHIHIVNVQNAGSAAKTGDLNGDNAVDITDLSLMLSSYGQTTTQCVTNSAYKCDLSTPGDNTVNIFDLSILLSHYGS